MTTTVDLLQHLGLNKYEAEAYYTLLLHGSLTGYEVGKQSHVPLSRSYEILERLLEKGLVLIQPGEPPHYAAQDPQVVLKRYRSAVEETLDTLTTSLASLHSVDTMNEFWVVRGQQNILTQVRALIENAQTMLYLILPTTYDVTESLIRAKTRGCHIFQPSAETHESQSVILVRDGHEALVGETTNSPEFCQAILSSNDALLETLRGYFLYRQLPPEVAAAVSSETLQPHAPDWIDWEARKQRRLWSIGSRNRIA